MLRNMFLFFLVHVLPFFESVKIFLKTQFDLSSAPICPCKENDKVLHLLVRKKLGAFYFDMGRVRDMKEVRTEVARGLEEFLGGHPLALTAQSEDAYVHLLQGRLHDAHEVWEKVAGIQDTVVPQKDRRELYRTQFYKGMAE